MTDNEIIKALECCSTNGRTCEECPYDGQTTDEIFCDEIVMKDALDLINRRDAEIERLQKHIQEGICLAKQIPEMVAKVKTEAIKEFAERLKGHRNGNYIFISTELLDNLVEEMEGKE